MNRLRVNDRQQNYNLYVQSNRHRVSQGLPAEPIPADANRSIFDELILRVVDSNVVVQVAGMTAQELMALAGLAPSPTSHDIAASGQVPEPLAPADPNYQGDHDTAPKADENPF